MEKHIEHKHYHKAEQVLFFNPLKRLLSKVFGAKYFVIKCKCCEKIPCEVLIDSSCAYCLSCYSKKTN